MVMLDKKKHGISLRKAVFTVLLAAIRWKCTFGLIIFCFGKTISGGSKTNFSICSPLNFEKISDLTDFTLLLSSRWLNHYVVYHMGKLPTSQPLEKIRFYSNLARGSTCFWNYL